jgi:hypothetical protein
MKSGLTANLPSLCATGELYFATDAPPGQNTYGCTATNTWSVEGSLTVESVGSTVGQRGTINFEAGAGIVTVMTDSGSEIDVLLGLDTAVVQTPWAEQSGSALLCASTSGSSSSYGCSLQPTLQSFTTGMTLHWTPDVNGAGGPTTLNVDTLGAVPVKQADGATDPSAAQIPAGRMQTIWYDGTNFRLTTTNTASTIVSTTAVLKGDGNGNVVAAVPGLDYAPATSTTAILKGNGSGGFSSATAGTDYQAPGSYITGLTGDVTATGPGSVAASVTKVNGGSIPASATLVGTDSNGKLTSLAVTSLPATCTPGGAPSVVAYTTGGSTQVCSCTGTNAWTCGGGTGGTNTNGTNGQALTSNGSGAFGTPVTLGGAATLNVGTTSGTVAAGNAATTVNGQSCALGGSCTINAGSADILRFSICITAGCGSETTVNYIATMGAGSFTECAFNLATAATGSSVIVDVQDASGTSIFGSTKLVVGTGSASVVYQSTFASSQQNYARGNKYKAVVTQNDSGNTAQGGTVQCR